MAERISIEGYAIISADGMIADRDCEMPPGLKIEADVRFFNHGLDTAAVIVHGRNSHEQQKAESDSRRRLIVSKSVMTLDAHPRFPMRGAGTLRASHFPTPVRRSG